VNTAYRKSLPGTTLEYFDAKAAVDAIAPGAYDRLPYTSKVWPKTWSAAAIPRP